MFGSSLSNRLKAFDVYKKLPRDLTEPTLSGALVSIVSTMIMIILLINETRLYISTYENAEMYIDVDRDGERLVVNLDVIILRTPCDILSLDYQDAMESHMVNVEGNLDKIRVKSTGEAIEVIPHDRSKSEGESRIDSERAKKAFEDKEACQFKGFFYVHRVPGNFHIATHGFGGQFFYGFGELGITTYDLSHRINHLSFGEEDDFKVIRKKFGSGILSPLDGTEKHKPVSVEKGLNHRYHLNVVPTTYEDLSGNRYHVHQFTALSSEEETYMIPVLEFAYDLSPVTIKFKLEAETFWEFLVQICAIIGGIFTVSGIIDALIHKSMMTIIKKVQRGKLS